MPVTINGTTGIAGPDGSASTPAVQGTDSNTGFFFPAANEMAITANGSVAANFPAGVTFGFKNRIINGAMVIDQRATSVTNANWTVDRFYYNTGTASKGTAAISTNAPTGFINSLGFTSSSAYSVAASDYFSFQQPIEGLNISDLAWGTASAKTVTLSFWVRSSLTGTFGGSLRNSGAARSYVFSYTISAANTWEYKTITILGDTSGTWLTTNGVGIFVGMAFAAGSNNLGTAGSWSASNLIGPTGQTSVVGTNGATFYITGVQLEIGSQATAFDWRPYGTELMLCQRYFYIAGGNFYGNVSYQQYGMGSVSSTTVVSLVQPFPVTMRTSPTFTAVGAANFNIGAAAGTFTASAVALDIASPINANINYTSSGMTAGQACNVYQNAANLTSLSFSAEL